MKFNCDNSAENHRFVVISYDNDQQQTFYDFVNAEDENKAQELIAEIRPYAIPVGALYPDEMRKMALQLESVEDYAINAHIHTLVLEADILEEDETVEGWHQDADGKVWRGSREENPNDTEENC